MYLSQLILNPRSRQVIAELEDAYQMHRTLSAAFTQGASDEEGTKVLLEARPLFRVDETPQGKVLLLVQSQAEPSWSHLEGRNYLLEAPQSMCFNPSLEPGQMLGFRLRANPTKANASNRSEKRQRGKRVGLFTDADRRNWLLRQAQRCGFDISVVGKTKADDSVYDFRLKDENTISTKSKSGSTATFSAAVFEGRLVVRDKSTLESALANGIGPAKAFGFGLLSLRRV